MRFEAGGLLRKFTPYEEQAVGEELVRTGTSGFDLFRLQAGDVVAGKSLSNLASRLAPSGLNVSS
jgi:hypothetical protein